MKHESRKKAAIILTMLMVSMAVANANPVNEQMAKEIGAKYLSKSVKMRMNVNDMQLAKTYFMANGDAAFYVFNAAKGFVIVSAQEVAIPILGYSDEGHFDANNIPENMNWWLQDYANQIQYGIEERNIDFEKTAKQWELVKSTGRLSEDRTARRVVEPLLKDEDSGEPILWNQSTIYSTQCPVIPNSENHYAAGCVPVSMSQIMRKWKHPAQGIGSHTSDGSHHETIDFSSTTYDWDHMPVSLNSSILGREPSSEEIEAVGTLLHHAGVAVDCFYKLSGTDAHSEKVPPALIDYFGFSDEARLEKLTNRDDSIAIWKVKLRSSLNHGYPMYYSGIYQGSLGHAFACDGYDDDDNFHINWGYDGNCNGYFPIGGLNYGSGATGQYNACNDAIFNIHPAGTTTVFDINVSANNDDYGTATTQSANVEYGGMVTVTASPKPGYCFNYWSLNGVNMSESATYSFSVYYDRDLVAVFSTPYTVTTASANEEQGTVSAGGTFNYGETCTLTATPQSGYIFVNWTKGGDVVSSHNPYNFKVTENGDYVANFRINEGVTISSGDTYETQCYPFGKNYKYYITEQIFTADEINCRGSINRIAFFATDAITRSLDIYLTTTEKSSFVDKNDWITVTDSDLVYSGTVSFANSDWTFIELFGPFEYDGLSNLVILIDDNTGTNPTVTKFKAFEGTAQQAMVYQTDENASPFSLEGFSATFIGTYDSYTYKVNRKNQIVLGIIPDASTTYPVTVTVEPAGAGYANGAGDFIFGETCTLTAEANEQFAFVNWTRNGVQVSTDLSYSFNVKEAHDLVANFMATIPLMFMDSEVEAICVANWDANGDGFLTNAEAANVTNLGTVFQSNTNITAFEELSYFTGLTAIPNNAFNGCTNLTRIVIPENITSISDNAFKDCSKLEGNLSLPSGLLTIGVSAFYNCSSLTGSLVIPDEVTTIGIDAFNGCTGFDGTLTIGNKVTTINSRAFNGCTSFTGDLIIPNSVNNIYGSAFYGCNGFNGSLIIGNSVSSISYSAFQGCSGFTNVIIERSTPPTVTMASTFTGMDFTIPVYVPAGSVSTYQGNTPGWSQFTNYMGQIQTSSWETPTSSDVICVNNDYTITSDVSAYYVYFTSDDNVLTVGSGNTLTVTGDIATTSASQLVIADGAQLICNKAVLATMQKNVTAASNWGSGSYTTDGWYFIATPVDGFSVSAIANGIETTDLFSYDEPSCYWWNAQSGSHAFGSLTRGQGYLYANNTDRILGLYGTMPASNAEFVANLSYENANADIRGFNLLGNPFTRDLTGSDIMLNGSAITTYYTVQGGSEIVSKQIAENPIKPGQGFIVQANGEGQSLVFNSSSKGGTHVKPAYICIEAGNESFMDFAFVQIGQGNTLHKMTINDIVPHVSVAQQGKDYAAIAVENYQEEGIPVNFRANEKGRYTIKVNAENVELGYLHLVDNLTGADIDLLETSTYTFEAGVNDYPSRFRLVFCAEGDNDTNEESFAFVRDGNIVIVGSDASSTLQIVDMTGRVVFSGNTLSPVSTEGLTSGVYVLRLIGQNSVKTQKLAIRSY